MIRRWIYKQRDFDNRKQAESWLDIKEQEGWSVVSIRPLPAFGLWSVTVRKTRGIRHVAR